ncbi:hypothetical protein Hanom_Chr17g01584971 [Helianthus anomalus]
MFVFVFLKDYLNSDSLFYNKTRFSFTYFLEKRAEFPLFLDAPDNTGGRYFFKI